MQNESIDDVIREYLEEEREAREIRRRMANWSFIESQPPRIRAALKLYIEKGDIRLASRIAGMGIDEFRELLRKANIPVVT